MTAYIFALVKNISDQDLYSKYVEKNSPTVAKYGGRFLYRNGPRELLEGNPIDDRIVILEFNSVEAAKNWYHSPDYTKVKAIRCDIAEASLYVIDSLQTASISDKS